MEIDSRLAEIDDCLYRLAIRALIFNKGKVLLVREKDGDWWGFPGGGIDHGEYVSETLPREIEEELGVPAKEIKVTNEIAHVSIGTVVNGVPRANLFYVVEVPIDSIHVTDETLELGWFVPAEIPAEVIARYAGPSTGGPAKLVQALEAEAAR